MAQKISSENGWQDSKPDVHARISHLWQNDFMSDFMFVSEGVKFPVHKFVLASTSSVFYLMFYGPMAEQKHELDVSSFGNAKCISQLLKFVYTDEVSLNWRNVFKLLNLAKCYMISSLQKKCTEFIEESVTKDNVLVALQLSLVFEVNSAIKKCLEIIAENAPQIVNQELFLSVNLASLKAILELDTLEIKEIDLFLAVNRWCENQLIKEGKEVTPKLKRKVLGDVVYLIRFPVMEWKDFGEHCSKSGILTQEQVIDILHCISLDGKDLQETLVSEMGFCSKSRKGQKQRKKEHPKKRQSQRKQEIVADHTSPSQNGCWRYDNGVTPDVIDFKINKKALLTGISIYGDPKYNQISEMKIRTQAGTFSPAYTSGEKILGPVPNSFRVSFNRPFEILPNEMVNVRVLVSGPGTKFCMRTKEVFTIDGFKCQLFKTSKLTRKPHVTQGEQIPALIFEVWM